MKRPSLKTCCRSVVAGIGLSCAWWILVPPSAAQVEEWYARGIFPVLARMLVPVVDSVPFSLSAVFLAAAPFAAAILAVRSWRRGRREGVPAGRVFLRWLEVAVSAGVVFYALFVFLWAANYRRPRLSVRLGLEVRTPHEEDVRSWIGELTRVLRRDVPASAERNTERALASLRRSLGRVIGQWDGRPPRLPTRVKRLPAGWLLAFGTSGVTTPILEAHGDAGDADVSFLCVAVHELAHSAGICAEADADLAAAIAGIEADDAYARYAMALRLFREFARYLPRDESRLAWGKLPEAARKDTEEIRAARTRYRVRRLARIQRRVYGTYLRSQGLKEGLREYSFVARLLVAAGKKGWVRFTAAGESD